MVTGGASQGCTVGASVTVGCGRGMQAVGVAGSLSARARCTGDNAGLRMLRQQPQSCAKCLRLLRAHHALEPTHLVWEAPGQ